MGSACCVARTRSDGTFTNGIRGETLHRNAIYSPSWSRRWDNRRRVAGEIENISYDPSCGISTNSSMERKGDLILDRSNVSDREIHLGNFGTPTSQKSPMHEGAETNMITSSDMTMAGNDGRKVQSSTESPEIVDSSASKLSLSVPSSSSSLKTDCRSFVFPTCSFPANLTQSRRVYQSPGHRLSRQVSDSQILGQKSPSNDLVAEGTPSFVPSTCSNDMRVGSQGGPSDGWSMRTFTELVASSQRERWSFDSEYLGSSHGKLSESSSTFSYSPSADLQTCGVCSKLLTEKSSWSSQKIISSNELSVIAVLVCGHAYHAECLEAMTQEADRYDPFLPNLYGRRKTTAEMAKKILRAEAEMKLKNNKIYRNRVVDSYRDAGYEVLDHRKTAEEKYPKMEASSSGRRSFAKPFLKRHFSLGSRWGRSLSENTSARKGFWARYLKD